MPRWYESANEAAFKPAPGGHVFQAPSPWMLARSRYHLVNDAQKAELLARLGRWRLLLLIAFVVEGALVLSIMLPMTLWPRAVARLVAPMHHQLGTDLFAVAMGVLMVLLMIPIFAVPQIYLARALRPVLANAPRTDERIRISEQLAKIAVSVPGWVLAFGLVGGLAAMSLGIAQMFDDFRAGHLARSAFANGSLLVVGVLMIAYVVYLLRIRAKSKQTKIA
jgi:hypothetical protein